MDLFLKALQKSVDKLSEPRAFPDCISLIVLNTSEPSDSLSHSSTIWSGNLGKLYFMEKLGDTHIGVSLDGPWAAL